MFDSFRATKFKFPAVSNLGKLTFHQRKWIDFKLISNKSIVGVGLWIEQQKH
jgi:hypothetical protein